MNAAVSMKDIVESHAYQFKKVGRTHTLPGFRVFCCCCCCCCCFCFVVVVVAVAVYQSPHNLDITTLSIAAFLYTYFSCLLTYDAQHTNTTTFVSHRTWATIFFPDVMSWPAGWVCFIHYTDMTDIDMQKGR